MSNTDHTEENNDGILKYLTASASSRFWLAIFVVSIFALISMAVVVSNDGARSNVKVDPAGIDAVTATEASPNRVNTAQLPDSSFIYDVSIEELANADSYIDGQTVQVIGEVVGDRITAEDNPSYCWILLQSVAKTDSELSIYIPIESTSVIDTYGAYGKRGTRLQVRGTFNLACKDHQGASEMHAEHVTVVEAGTIETMPFDAASLIPGIILIIIGSISMLAYNILQERER